MELENFADSNQSETVTIKSPFGDKLAIGWDTKNGMGRGGDEDSAWAVASEWSTCSVACGGGTSTK